jgi:hypothetical protein
MFARFALPGFTLAALVHVASLMGVDVQAIVPGVWLLHLGVFLVREISEAEFHARRSVQMRIFSGTWLVFYFAPFAFFALRRSDDAQTPPQVCR